MVFKVQTLNNISARGLERLPRERYEVASALIEPHAILVRSAKMHEMDIPASEWPNISIDKNLFAYLQKNKDHGLNFVCDAILNDKSFNYED